MKTLLLFCAVWIVGVGGVRADLTMVQKTEGSGQDVETTARLKVGKTRVDTSPGTSLILNAASGGMIELMHMPKTYVKVSTALPPPTGDGSPSPKPALAATGKKDTICGFAAEEYTAVSAGAKLTLWLTKALPEYEMALKELSGVPLMQLNGLNLTSLPGFPLRTVVEAQPGQIVTRTIISVSTKPVPDAEFEVPAGYKEIAVPVLTPPAPAPDAFAVLTMSAPTLVLASTSPRRRDLLTAHGYAFIAAPAPVVESAAAWLSARELVLLNAGRKSAARRGWQANSLVLGVDTLVSLEGQTLGKPQDLADAAQMLTRLAGQTHQVYTGVSLDHADTGRVVSFVEETRVTFLPLGPDEIAAYHRLIDPLDKAGAYAAQEHGEKIIAAVEGSWSNVMGLPMERLTEVLAREFSIHPVG